MTIAANALSLIVGLLVAGDETAAAIETLAAAA
jgi:hypothetical protein